MEIFPITGAILLSAGFIFILRVVGITLSTVRTLVMMRGMKVSSCVIGFFEMLVYVIALGEVVSNLANAWNILGYCLGFSVGTYIGMCFEDRLALGFSTLRIISRYRGKAVATAIREAGYGATEDQATGQKGVVSMIMVVLRRKDISAVMKVVSESDPEAFVTIDETRAIRQGFIRLAH